MRIVIIGFLVGLCILSAVQAEEIIPGAEQTTLLRGRAEVNDGIRAVTGETDAIAHYGQLDPELSQYGIDQEGPIKQFLV